jgi:hypothetical protein
MQKPLRYGRVCTFFDFNNYYFIVVSADAGAAAVSAGAVAGAASVLAAAAAESTAVPSSAFGSEDPHEAKPNNPAIIKTANSFFIFGLIY